MRRLHISLLIPLDMIAYSTHRRYKKKTPRSGVGFIFPRLMSLFSLVARFVRFLQHQKVEKIYLFRLPWKN
jgi:hypothetical protein